MTHRSYFFRTPGQSSPRLALAQSYWALQERGIPIEQLLTQACDAGFEFIECGLHQERMEPLRSILSSLPLSLIAQGFANTARDARIYFERAVELNAVAMNLHLGHAYLGNDETDRLLDDAVEMAEEFEMPLMLETHRGRLTQDLFRTSKLMDRRPNTRIALDVSHYLVAGETLGGDDAQFHACLAPLINATELIHGRISNGQQIQVSTLDGGSFARASSIWRKTMKNWLDSAPPDAVLVFEPELGPPPYAYIADGIETASRNAETHELVRIARQVWQTAIEGDAL